MSCCSPDHTILLGSQKPNQRWLHLTACGAAMGVYESISHVDGSSSCCGVRPACGVEVERERRNPGHS
jgi:hypothetical protein